MLVGIVRRWQRESSRLVRPLLSRPKTRAMFCWVGGSFAGRFGQGNRGGESVSGADGVADD